MSDSCDASWSWHDLEDDYIDEMLQVMTTGLAPQDEPEEALHSNDCDLRRDVSVSLPIGTVETVEQQCDIEVLQALQMNSASGDVEDLHEDVPIKTAAGCDATSSSSQTPGTLGCELSPGSALEHVGVAADAADAAEAHADDAAAVLPNIRRPPMYRVGYRPPRIPAIWRPRQFELTNMYLDV